MSKKNYNRDYTKPNTITNEQQAPEPSGAENLVGATKADDAEVEKAAADAVVTKEQESEVEKAPVEEKPELKPTTPPAPLKFAKGKTTRNVYMRKEPTQTGEKVMVVPAGTLIDIVSVPNPSWIEAKIEDGTKGFIMTLYTEEVTE